MSWKIVKTNVKGCFKAITKFLYNKKIKLMKKKLRIYKKNIKNWDKNVNPEVLNKCHKVLKSRMKRVI